MSIDQRDIPDPASPGDIWRKDPDGVVRHYLEPVPARRARCMPCPFCGSRRLLRDVQITIAGDIHLIECETCGAQGPKIVPGEDSDGTWSRQDATRAWNTRAGG